MERISGASSSGAGSSSSDMGSMGSVGSSTSSERGSNPGGRLGVVLGVVHVGMTGRVEGIFGLLR